MAPAQVFIVRHGERVDHKDPSFSLSTDRPHDSPLTEDGRQMGVMFGAHVVQHLNVQPANVVVLASPLLRTVQTADGIVDGLLTGSGPDQLPIPIYLEKGMAEGGFWMFHDMRKNPNVVSADGVFCCPQPIYRDAHFHKQHTSPRVALSNPFALHCDPDLIITPTALQEADTAQRCARGAAALRGLPDLDGKSIILVGHGETILRWFDGFTGGRTPQTGVAYTGFMHLKQDATGQLVPQMEAFATPHLRAVPAEN